MKTMTQTDDVEVVAEGLHVTLADLQAGLGSDVITEEVLDHLKAGHPDASVVLRNARVAWDRANRTRVWGGIQGKWVLLEHSEGFKMWIKLGDSVSSAIIRGVYDRATTNIVREHLRPGGNFIDIGANVGWFSFVSAHYYNSAKGGHVYTFEPQKNIFEHIVRSIASNGYDKIISAHRMALGDRNGEIQMVDAGLNSGGSSIVRSEITRPDFETVPIRRFDEVAPKVERVDLIKIDIEGAEPLFLQGAREFISRHRPPIISEVSVRKLRLVSGSDAASYIRSVAEFGYVPLKVAGNGRLVELDSGELVDDRTVINVYFKPVP